MARLYRPNISSSVQTQSIPLSLHITLLLQQPFHPLVSSTLSSPGASIRRLFLEMAAFRGVTAGCHGNKHLQTDVTEWWLYYLQSCCLATDNSYKKYPLFRSWIWQDSQVTEPNPFPFNHYLTPCNTVFFEKLIFRQPVKKFPAFFLIRMFTKALHLSYLVYLRDVE
jgi:hypothetical protein